MSSPTIKIVIATPLFPPEIGGPATYAELLVNQLPSQGVLVRLVKFSEVKHLPKIIRHLAYTFRLLVAARGAKIIFALDPVSVGLPAMVTAKLLNKKIIIRIAGDYAWEQGCQRFGIKDLLDAFVAEDKGYPWQVRALKRVQAFVAKQADRIIVPSKYLAGVITKWGVKPEKIIVVYNAFHLDYEPVSKTELRLLLDLKGRVIVTAGRLVPWKGFETLIEVIKELKITHPDIYLVIIGSGPDASHLSNKIASIGLGGTVKMTGKLLHQELLKYCKAADVFVLNTGYEGFSHQLLEAMALGLPIVTTNVGGNSELVEHGRSGLLLAYNDKESLIKYIGTLLENPEEASRLGANALERVSAFNEEALIENTVKVLQSI